MNFSFQYRFNINNWFVSRLSFIIGVIILSVGCYLAVKKVAFLSSAIDVPAKVVQVQPSVVFEYKSDQGQQAYYKSGKKSDPPTYHVGQEVILKISPEGDSIYVSNFFDLYFLEPFLVVYGLLWSIFSWFFLKPNSHASSKKDRDNDDYNQFKIIRDKPRKYALVNGKAASFAMIEKAIQDVRNNKQDFVILEKGNSFIQYAGANVECCLDGNIFKKTVKDNLLPNEVMSIFKHYAKAKTSGDKLFDKYAWVEFKAV